VKSGWEDSWPVPRLEGDSAYKDAPQVQARRDVMSEDETRRIAANDEPETDEVEAHTRRVAAADEPKQEGDDDEVEAHSRRVS
jgi:hypothetical protein